MLKPRLAGAGFLLLVGLAGGVLLHKPILRLLEQLGASAGETNFERTESPPKKDKKLVAVDPGIATALGIEVAVAEPAELVREVRVVGTVGFDEAKLARLVARVPGNVRQVLKNVGDIVAAGDVLAVLESREIAEAKSGYLAAHERQSLAEVTVHRLEELVRLRAASDKDLLKARWDLNQAKIEARASAQKLLSVGLAQAELDQLASGRGELSQFEIRAPFAGEVLERRAFPGEFVPSDRELFVVADLDLVWINLQVAPEKLRDVTVGKPVRIVGSQGLSADAKIDYIAPVVSDETRTVRSRVVLANPEHRWRPGVVVDAVVTGAAEPAAVTVPNEALQTVDGRLSVFLPVQDGFRMQPVKAGRSDAKRTEIVKGLAAGDKVATGQTFVLKAELEKGAGDDD
jgi:cobalt-zinc-cadmium efflux system membrane fusion protein